MTKSSSTKAFLFILIFLTSSSNFAQFVTVKGKEFYSSDGKPLFLKGINLGNWLLPEGYMFKFQKTSSPRLIFEMVNQLVGEDEARKFWNAFYDEYITHEDIKFIKAAGFNSIRLPFNYKLFVNPNDHLKIEGKGFELIDRCVKWCKEKNLYVIFDMHGAPGGQTGDNIDDSYGYPFLYEDEDAQQTTILIWKKIAEIYKDEPIVIGYDLLNEPIAHYFDKDKLNPLLVPLFKKITKSIREVDNNHIIFFGGAQWNSNFSVFAEPFDDKAVYTFHKYWTDTTQSVIQEYVDYSNKYNVPLWMGESGENTNEWITSFRKLLEVNNISWCFWPYKKMDAPSNVVSVSKPNNWDLILKYSEADRSSYSSIRENRPDINIIRPILAEYLENIKFKNCIINSDYLKALGLK
ncbi:MAG: glycoside hydrolase family 5 protein [Ignavibacteria bacterium]|nr:glycoside hydrolase family 5 protein [Ignavibacteria bacterium]